MKPAFTARLVNGPFGDPGLYINLRWEGRSMLFDLGHNNSLPPGEILKITYVFISHCHMDHFIGFDHLLRLFLARDKTLRLFGPAGTLACVEGKLKGYTWNLVDGYPFLLEVSEVYPERIHRARFSATSGFIREDFAEDLPFTGTLIDEDILAVRAVHLDHRISCLAFAIEEKTHLNVDKDLLVRLGVPPGRWLNELKQAIRQDRPDTFPIIAKWRENGQEKVHSFLLGDLRYRLVQESRGQKVVYVVDTLFSKDNEAKIVHLAQGADLFFCEAPFLDQDRDQATMRYHLTARQAGHLARVAAARRLVVFHFSPRYSGMGDKVYQEAQAEFQREAPGLKGEEQVLSGQQSDASQTE